MKKFNVIGTLTALTIIFFATISVHANDDITVYYEGQLLNFDQSPIIVNDRVMVPMRPLFESMGYEVEWNPETQTATAIMGSEKIHVKVGYERIICENTEVDSVPCDVVPQIVSDRMLVPLRAFSQASGCYVYWNGNTRTVFSYDWQNVVTAYKSMLQEYQNQRKSINDEYFYPYYYVYDIDKNGVPELIINENESEATKEIHVYTYDLLTSSIKDLGSAESGHSALCSVPTNNNLMMIITQMGYEYVKIISVENGHISEQYIIEGKNCMYEDTIRYDEPSDLIEGSEYLQYSEVDDDQLIYMYYL